MVKPIDGPRPKPSIPTPAPVREAVTVPTGTPQTAIAVAGSAFDSSVKKKIVSITGGHKAHAPGVLHSKLTVPTASAVASFAKVPKDVGGLIDAGTKLAPKDDDEGNFTKKEAERAKAAFCAVDKAIAKGDYQAAYESMDKLLSKDEDVVKSLGDDAEVKAYAVKDQLAFLAKMQAAGVKADYPPTEAQLVEYFSTLKDDPRAARGAFEEYTTSFHIHPANIPGADGDVKYSADKMVVKGDLEITTHVPNSWSEVSKRPADAGVKPGGVGKQVNDCEGYAYMAEKLLGAAGFKLENHLTVHGSPMGEHAMVMFSHPKEKGVTVTSNDGVFHGTDKKKVAAEAYGYAMPKRDVMKGGKPVLDRDGNPKQEPDVTGREKFYTGKTMHDSQVGAMSGGKAL